MADKSLHGSLKVPGDKSISHRALIFSALSQGEVKVTGLSPAEDVASTARCLTQLGLKMESSAENAIAVHSPGLSFLTPPQAVLDAGNSGTTMRIMSGLVAGQPFTTTFDGDSSLRRRPMGRVLDLLIKMGASVTYEGRGNGKGAGHGCAPFAITGGKLKGQVFNLPQASAQVQTALMLAALQAEGTTTIALPAIARDHTQRMFRYIGVPFEETGEGTLGVARLTDPVPPFQIDVPADLSSAAFFMVAAALLPGSDLLLTDVGINIGRRLIIDVLQRMGACVLIVDERERCGEPVADIRVRHTSRLRATTISGAEIAQGIDEVPILAIAGALCEGTFTVQGAEELKHKESNRLSAITSNLRASGATVEDTPDGFIVEGQSSLKGGSNWETFNDHRLAMTGLIARLVCDSPVTVSECESVKISYPQFQQDLDSLTSN